MDGADIRNSTTSGGVSGTKSDSFNESEAPSGGNIETAPPSDQPTSQDNVEALITSSNSSNVGESEKKKFLLLEEKSSGGGSQQSNASLNIECHIETQGHVSSIKIVSSSDLMKKRIVIVDVCRLKVNFELI